jgi:hypothetical protein
LDVLAASSQLVCEGVSCSNRSQEKVRAAPQLLRGFSLLSYSPFTRL